MPSQYLQGDDLTTYGVPNATTAQVIAASALIDGYLVRPEGLVWMPDGNGNPCYMANLMPSITLTATEAILLGQNVNVAVTGSVNAISLGSSQCGLVAILDRNNPEITEACIVNSIVGNVITLQNVQFNHMADCLLEFGLVIFEERQMPQSRPLVNLRKTPVQIILAGQGRYGYGRRGNENYLLDEFNLLAVVAEFGGPPIWEIFNQTLVGVDPMSGQVWAPAGILLSYYSEIRFSYIAGWQYSGLPTNIKLACANLINATIVAPVAGAIQSFRAGDTAITRFASTALSDDTKMLLNPFRARLYV